MPKPASVNSAATLSSAAPSPRRVTFTRFHDLSMCRALISYARQKRPESARLERVHATPEVVVECPRCGFEFKVGKSLK